MENNNNQLQFCPKCGSPLIAGKSFCSQCGANITLAQQPAQQANPYARPQQPAQQANPYARPQQPAQQANPYARPQQPAQQANPYAQSQQPAQQANPYARPQQATQQTNPYAKPQQPTQQANPYAQPQQSAQQTNPYAQPQQPAQQTNPYAQPQQATQQTNPYAQPQQASSGVVSAYGTSSADNNFSQPINPYASNDITASENLVAPKKRSKKPLVIAGVSVVGVAAVAVAGVMVFNMLKPSGGPITKIADSAKQLVKANSATVSTSVEANGEKTKCDISYEIDASKKEIVLVMNGSNLNGSSSSNDTFKGVIYCKDGVRKSAFTLGSNTTYTEIDEETLNNFFDSLNKTNAEQDPDWNSLLEDANLKDYIDATKIDAVSDSLKNTFENGEGKEALGITESSVDNGTKYSFDVDTYKTLSVIVDEIEPLFKDKSKYNEIKEELPEAESYLGSVNLKFDITVDNAGYFSGFSFDSFGTKIDFSISNVGNTKVELSESEINDIKNAETTSPSTSYIPDKYYDGDNAGDDVNQVYDFA